MNILKCVIIFFNFHKHFNEIKTYFVLHPHFDSVCYSNKNKNIQREGISTISEDFFYNCICYLYYILHWVCINIFFLFAVLSVPQLLPGRTNSANRESDGGLSEDPNLLRETLPARSECTQQI